MFVSGGANPTPPLLSRYVPVFLFLIVAIGTRAGEWSVSRSGGGVVLIVLCGK